MRRMAYRLNCQTTYRPLRGGERGEGEREGERGARGGQGRRDKSGE